MTLAQTFAQTGFARFINSPAGRAARIIAGVALLLGGYTQGASILGIALVAGSLVPLLAGSLDWCLVSGLLGGPMSGAILRNSKPGRR